jgi:hypothetical protein
MTSDLENVIAAIQQHLASADEINMGGRTFRLPVAPIQCRDGSEFSVQAGETVYSSPRNNTGPWDSAEVMSLSGHTPINWHCQNGDVAGWVPLEAIAKEILDRGFLALTAE